MAHMLEVPWNRIRVGNRVAAPGEPRRVATVTRKDSGYVDVIFEDGTRARHLADERARVFLSLERPRASDEGE